MASSELPTELVDRYGLARHNHMRGPNSEYWFLYEDRRPRLPVRRDGELCFARWGNGRGQSRHLPRASWTWLKTVDEGGWRESGAVPIIIPATFAVERGVWYRVREGIRGLLVGDERGKAVVYMICEPASHYYQVMTRSERMPVLVSKWTY